MSETKQSKSPQEQAWETARQKAVREAVRPYIAELRGMIERLETIIAELETK